MHPNGNNTESQIVSQFANLGTTGTANVVNPLKNGSYQVWANGNSQPPVGGDFWNYTANKTVIGQETYPGGWDEWYAQSFAIQVNAKVNSCGYAVDPDALVGAGFFQCTAGAGGFLALVYAGQPIDLPTACTATLPAGWTEVQ